MKKILIMFFASVFVFGCATTMQTTSAEAEFQKNNPRWPDYSLADFSKGQKLYSLSCSGCHPLHKPSELNEQQWTNILPIMTERAMLGDSERELIFRYLITENQSANTGGDNKPN